MAIKGNIQECLKLDDKIAYLYKSTRYVDSCRLAIRKNRHLVRIVIPVVVGSSPISRPKIQTPQTAKFAGFSVFGGAVE